MTQVLTSAPAALPGSLFVLRGANMASTADQAFTRVGGFSNYVITGVVAVRKTGSYGIACLGGIYTGASKTGSALLSASQSFALMTGAGTAQAATLANLLQSVVASGTPILSLTTGNTGALTADLFIAGYVVD